MTAARFVFAYREPLQRDTLARNGNPKNSNDQLHDLKNMQIVAGYESQVAISKFQTDVTRDRSGCRLTTDNACNLGPGGNVAVIVFDLEERCRQLHEGDDSSKARIDER